MSRWGCLIALLSGDELPSAPELGGDLHISVLGLFTGYVAGFVDPEVSNRTDLFDVYVNLPESVITVSQSAKGTMSSSASKSSSSIIPSCFYAVDPCPITESMAMGKLHRDIGHLIMQTAEDPEKSESQVVKVRCPKRTCIKGNLEWNMTAPLWFTGYFGQDKRDPC